MEYFDYKDIYAKKFLNEIKENIKSNKILFPVEVNKEKDKIMIEVIKGQSDNFLRGMSFSNGNETEERMMCTLMLYYTALCNDNVDYLNKLLEYGYEFGINRKHLSLYALDKKLTSQFDIDKYCQLLMDQSIIFKNFYESLINSSIETKLTDEEIINIFCNIINKNPKITYTEEVNYSDKRPILHSNLLTKKSISYFGEDLILNATEMQKKNIITQLSGTYRELPEELLNKLKNLMKNYNFSTNMFCGWEAGLRELTEEELLKIDKSYRNTFHDNFISGTGVCIHSIKKEINGELIKNSTKDSLTSKKRGLRIFKNRY